MERRLTQLTLASVLVALGVVIAPFLWFPVLASKAYPGQHMINAIAGVLLGPWWAALIAFCIGIIRMSLGIGTIYSMPGGIPGAIVVGLVYTLLKKARVKRPEIAALFEPIGTVLIGGTLSVYVIAPFVGSKGMAGALIPVWTAWAMSSVPGSIMGFIILEVLRAAGVYDYLKSKERA